MKQPLVLVASPDEQMQAAIGSALDDRALPWLSACSNLEIVYMMDTMAGFTFDGDPISAVVLDAREAGFGSAALEWLRQCASRRPLVVLADLDPEAHSIAELLEAAAVFAPPADLNEVGDVVEALVAGPTTALRHIWFAEEAR